MDPKTIDTNSPQESTFRELLNDSRKKKEFTDVQLQVGDKLFDAHRNVLSIYSPVLKAALSDHWSTSKICPLSDEYVDVQIVEDLLGFLYTGKIELTPENAYSICKAAHYLQIQALLDSSAKYLRNLIAVENVITLFQLAINCELPTLGERCLHFIHVYNKKVFQSSAILDFSSDNLKKMIEGLELFTTEDHDYDQSLPAHLHRRQNTFDCIVRWTETNLHERLKDLPKLLKLIPLDSLPFEFLNQTVANHPLVKESASCQQILSDAIENCCDRSLEVNQSLILIGNADPDNEDRITSSMIFYESWAWEDLPNLNRYGGMATAVINKRDIVVSGGFVNKDDYPDCVEMFDWTTQAWKELPSMPYPLINHSMTAHNDHLYVVGGDNYYEDVGDNHTGKTEVLCYTFATERWKYLKSLNVGQRHGFLFGYKYHLYAVGRESSIERYDPAFDTWTIIPTLGKSTTFYAAALHEDKIYVSGNEGFEVYDIRTKAWCQLEPTTLLRCNKLVSFNGDLLAFDSTSFDERDDKTSIFVLKNQIWTLFTPEPLKFAPEHALVISPL